MTDTDLILELLYHVIGNILLNYCTIILTLTITIPNYNDYYKFTHLIECSV